MKKPPLSEAAKKAFRLAMLAAAAIPLAASPLWAWSSATHQGITKAVVEAVMSDPAFHDIFPEKGDTQVPAESLDCLLQSGALDSKGDGRSVQSFAKNLMLNPASPASVPKPDKYSNYSQLADFVLGEKPGDCGDPKNPAAGSKVKAGDIIEAYVLEPDWGMDREVCNNGCPSPAPGNPSNPGLYRCDDVYVNMEAFCGGVASQAFRHMYWPEGYNQIAPYAKVKLGGALTFLPFLVGDLSDPNLGDGIVLRQVKTAVGQAPDRSKEFFERAVLAAKGHPYWALRFLAWSMHYAQDVTQPFHAAQIPGKSVEGYKDRIILDHDKTAARISYYHMSFENYMDNSVNAAIVAAGNSGWVTQGDPYWVTWNAAQFGSTNSSKAGDAAVAYFQNLPSNIGANAVQNYVNTPPPNTPPGTFHGYRPKPGNPPEAFTQIAKDCMSEAGSATKNLLWLFASKLPAASSGRDQAQAADPKFRDGGANSESTSRQMSTARSRMNGVLLNAGASGGE